MGKPAAIDRPYLPSLSHSFTLDFIVTGYSKEELEVVKPVIEDFMKARGLTLSPEKTKITPINDGFDFLGWNFRKYGGKLLRAYL